MNAYELIGAATGVLALLASVTFWLADRRRTQRRENGELEAGRQARIEAIDKRLIKVEAQTEQLEPLWRDIRFAAVHAATSLLHSPADEYGLDALIDKFRNGTLEPQETQEFAMRLKRVKESNLTPRMRHAAEILLREIERGY